MDTTDSRLAKIKPYPMVAYAETLLFFFGANFVFH